MDASVSTPDQWRERLSRPPVLSTEGFWRKGLLRFWRDTSPTMVQPPLDHHYAVLHLGGAKRVHRRGEGPRQVADAPLASVTVVPAGASFTWQTEGPIEFAHLYIDPKRLARAVIERLDKDPSSLQLNPATGVPDPVLGNVFKAMLQEAFQPGFASGPCLDMLLDAFMVRLLGGFSNLGADRTRARYALAPHRLRRVVEHVEASLEGELSLDDMARVAGLSRFHFSRTFARATGETPAAYVAARRLERARRLLRQSELSIAEIAVRSGFSSQAAFSVAFRRVSGTTPSAYRRG